MSRQEHDREDILREATALVARAEFIAPPFPQPIVAGFRRDGSASFFFGSERVLQFNSQGELRRAFDNGTMLKADHRRLVALHRERDREQVVLRSHPLTDEAQQQFLQEASALLQGLRNAFYQRQVRMVRQVPEDQDVAEQIAQWLTRCGELLVVAARPHAG
jgi:hypothetical protein